MARSDPSTSRSLNKGCGCALVIVILGIGSWILPIFGVQFRLVTALGETIGVSTSVAGLILAGAGILLGVLFTVIEGFTQPSNIHGYGTKITPETLQRIMPYLPEISSRLSNGDTFESVVENIASKEQISKRDVLKAIIALGPSYRQVERETSNVDE